MLKVHKIFLYSFCFANLSTAVAGTCPSEILEWGKYGTSPYQPTFPLTIDKHDLNLTVDDPSGAAGSLGVDDTYYVYSDEPEYIVYADLATLGADSITVNIDITGEPEMVYFPLYDVDGQTDPAFLRQEVYTITGSYQGNSVSPVFTPTSQMQVTGNTVRGYQEVKANPAETSGLEPLEGVLGVTFNEPVDNIQIVFSVDTQVTSISPSSEPGFGIGDIRLCDVQMPVDPRPAIPSTNWVALIVLLSLIIGGVSFYRKRQSA